MMRAYNEYYIEREAWDSQIAENSARQAWATGKVHTSGWGEIVVDEPIMFDSIFVHEPVVSYGFAMDDDEQLVDLRFPRCSGGVLRWEMSDDDFYVGAHVFITVATADPMLAAQAWVDKGVPFVNEDGTAYATAVQIPPDYETDPDYDITHSFTFTALAIKGVPG